MKFCSLILELHLPQFFFHTHTYTQTYRHTDRQTFSKNSQIVFRTSQNVQNSSKTENRKFARNQYFLLLIQKKVKSVSFAHSQLKIISYLSSHLMEYTTYNFQILMQHSPFPFSIFPQLLRNLTEISCKANIWWKEMEFLQKLL